MAADQIMEEWMSLVMAALDGDFAALRALIATTAQDSFVAGHAAAASVMGVTL
jgi:hypothetical protein